MEQPVQTLSYRRIKSNSTFTISVQQGNGTAIPVYEVLASNLDPNLTISRLQYVYPGQHSYLYAPPTPPSPYHQQQQQYQLPYPYAPSYQSQQYQPPPQPQQYHQYQVPNPQHAKVTIGTITLSSLSSEITFSIHNQTDIRMRRPDFLSSSHQFIHPRYGTLSWKESDLHDKKYKLLDSNKNVLARFDKYKPPGQKAKSSLWGSSSSDEGKCWAFSIFVKADPEFVDWIVVSGLGVVEYRVVGDQEWEEALIG